MPRKLTKDEWITKAVAVHGDKYDYSNMEYLGCMQKLEIFCKACSKTFKQYGNDHTSKKAGCPHCKGVARLTTEEFIKRATEVHKGKFDYSKVVYVNTVTPLTVICPVHGEIQVKPHGHLQGHDCDQCCSTYKLTTEEFVKRSKEKFGDKFDYSEAVYVSSIEPVTLLCQEFGRFQIKAMTHLLSATGYPSSIVNRPRGIEYFLKRSSDVHGDRYDYSKVEYCNKRTNVKIICKEHGEFLQTPNNHWSGAGCHKCATGGYKLLLDGYFYIYDIAGDIGFGITNVPNERHSAHKTTFKTEGVAAKRTHLFKGTGEMVYEIERHFKHTLPIKDLGVDGFRTEATTKDQLETILKYLRDCELVELDMN